MFRMLASYDLFQFYRWELAVVLTIYAGVITGQWLLGWLKWFGSSRQTAVLGRYASVLLLQIKIRRFAWELLQIVALLAAFGLVVYWNHLIVMG
jgi:hypothetical protein